MKKRITELQLGVIVYMESRRVTCHPTQVSVQVLDLPTPEG